MGAGAWRSRLGFGAAAAFAFLYLPLVIVVLYAFNATNINSWPFPGFSTRWFDTLWHDPAPREAAWLSVRVALFSTAFALLRGMQTVNFVVILPIILPGVITGVALASFFLFAGTRCRSAR